jgi:hypothetical protein
MFNFKNKELNELLNDLALRCGKTFLQSLIGAIGGAKMFDEVNFSLVLSISLFATFMCLLMNLYKFLSLKVGDKDDL